MPGKIKLLLYRLVRIDRSLVPPNDTRSTLFVEKPEECDHRKLPTNTPHHFLIFPNLTGDFESEDNHTVNQRRMQKVDLDLGYGVTVIVFRQLS